MKTRRREKKREQGKQETIHAPAYGCMCSPPRAGRTTSTRQGWIDDEPDSLCIGRLRDGPRAPRRSRWRRRSAGDHGDRARRRRGDHDDDAGRCACARGNARAARAATRSARACARRRPRINLTPTPPAADQPAGGGAAASGVGLVADNAADRIGHAHHRQAGRSVGTDDRRRQPTNGRSLPRLSAHAVPDQLRPADAGESPAYPEPMPNGRPYPPGAEPPVPGTQWHSPPRVPGYSYQTWEFTNTVHGPWTQLNFSYGNSRAMATVIVNATRSRTAATGTCRRSRGSTRRS